MARQRESDIVSQERQIYSERRKYLFKATFKWNQCNIIDKQ